MFLGESACLIVYYLNQYYVRSKKLKKTGYQSIDDDNLTDEEHDQLAMNDEPEFSISTYPSQLNHENNTNHQQQNITQDRSGNQNNRNQLEQEIDNEDIGDEDTNVNGLLELSGKKNLLLWLPTLCDMTATTLMNVGLLYISASIYQMLRGSVVLFTGTFSYWFLDRKHPLYRWIALLTVFLGVAIVGSSGAVQGSKSDAYPVSKSLVGVAMVVLAQAFTASQFVIEEKILSKYDIAPLKAVGLEGLFGLISVAVLLPFLYYTFGVYGESGGFFDLPAGWYQWFHYSQILYAGIGIIFSIAFFNWFGLAVTRHLSATSRSTIDTCRTIFIWMFSLSLGWETFKWLQVVGFVIMLFGTFLFNDIIRINWGPFRRPPSRNEEEVVTG